MTALSSLLRGASAAEPILTTTSVGAAAGTIIGANTVGGALTITAPGSPTASMAFRVIDVGGVAGTNNITINGGGSKIAGSVSDFLMDNNWIDVTFVYYDVTIGWAPSR